MGNHLISFMLAIPFLGALAQAMIPSAAPGAPTLSRAVAIATSVISSILAFVLLVAMDPDSGALQLQESVAWIGSYAITYEVGLDGLSALVLLVVAVVFPVLIAAEWNNPRGRRGMHGLLLLLQSSLMGAVCAQDLFVMFFFWTMSALPFYFLVAVWGNDEGREAAAFRFIVSATLGNVLLFAALVLVYYSVAPNTFLLRELAGGKLESKTFLFLGTTLPVAPVCVSLIGLGLALRVPLWPLHGWYTRTAQEAPFSVLAALQVAALSVGTYLFVRLAYSLFPSTATGASDVILGLGIVNLMLGSICALAQPDLRRLLSYLTLAATGWVLVGAASGTSASWVGLVFEQFASGLALAGFALLAGILLERTGSIRFQGDGGESSLGGIAARAPATALVGGFFLVAFLGFPGSTGFVARALVVVGSYPAYAAAVLLLGLSLIVLTYHLFKTYRAVFLGAPSESTRAFADLSLRERAYLLPLIATIVVFGIYPKPLVELVRSTVATLLHPGNP